MTDENKRLAVRDELQRSDASMKSAQILIKNELWNDAVSRLYYTAFYHIRALLLSRGIETKTHEGLLKQFSMHFIKPGVFATGNGRMMARLLKYREEADYNSSLAWEKADTEELMQEVTDLCGRVRGYLCEQGFPAT